MFYQRHIPMHRDSGFQNKPLYMSEQTRESTTLAKSSCEVPLAAAFLELWQSYFVPPFHDYLALISVLLTSDTFGASSTAYVITSYHKSHVEIHH